jgi:hypothetical protein
MTIETTTLERPETVLPPTQPASLPMNEALAQVRKDSRDDPRAFLDETVVPHGGE